MIYILTCFLLFLIPILTYWKSLIDYFDKTSSMLKLPHFALPLYPLVGNALSFPSNPNQLFRMLTQTSFEFINTTKQKFAVMWLGINPEIFILHPDATEVFLKSSKHTKKPKRYDELRAWLNDGLIMSYGAKWHRRRKLITPAFHYCILKDFLGVMNEQATTFVDEIKRIVESKEMLNIQKRLKLCTLDIICETAMGCAVNAQMNGELEFIQAIHRMGEIIHQRESNPLYMFDFIFNHSRLAAEQKKILQIIHGFTKSVIDQRLEETRLCEGLNSKPRKRKAFLDVLINATTEDGSKLSADDLQEEVDTFMVAGHDTSSSALSWAIYLLGRYPDVQNKLHEELDSVFGGDKTCDVTLDHIKDLSYLDLVIKETLRLYPPGIYIGRQVEEDCVIDGMKIPKGQNVTLFIYVIHRHPDIWEEPNKFIPERFEPENGLKANRSPFAYIPFSAGPRNCVGQRFAMQEQKVILAKFFREFSVTSLDAEEDLKVNGSLVFQIEDPLKLKLVRRIQ